MTNQKQYDWDDLCALDVMKSFTKKDEDPEVQERVASYIAEYVISCFQDAFFLPKVVDAAVMPEDLDPVRSLELEGDVTTPVCMDLVLPSGEVHIKCYLEELTHALFEGIIIKIESAVLHFLDRLSPTFAATALTPGIVKTALDDSISGFSCFIPIEDLDVLQNSAEWSEYYSPPPTTDDAIQGYIDTLAEDEEVVPIRLVTDGFRYGTLQTLTAGNLYFFASHVMAKPDLRWTATADRMPGKEPRIRIDWKFCLDLYSADPGGIDIRKLLVIDEPSIH